MREIVYWEKENEEKVPLSTRAHTRAVCFYYFCWMTQSFLQIIEGIYIWYGIYEPERVFRSKKNHLSLERAAFSFNARYKLTSFSLDFYDFFALLNRTLVLWHCAFLNHSRINSSFSLVFNWHNWLQWIFFFLQLPVSLVQLASTYPSKYNYSYLYYFIWMLMQAYVKVDVNFTFNTPISRFRVQYSLYIIINLWQKQ